MDLSNEKSPFSNYATTALFHIYFRPYFDYDIKLGGRLGVTSFAEHRTVTENLSDNSYCIALSPVPLPLSPYLEKVCGILFGILIYSKNSLMSLKRKSRSITRVDEMKDMSPDRSKGKKYKVYVTPSFDVCYRYA